MGNLCHTLPGGLLNLRPWENPQGISSTSKYRQDTHTPTHPPTHPHTHTYTHSQTCLTTEGVSGNEAFLPVNPSSLPACPAPLQHLLSLAGARSGVSSLPGLYVLSQSIASGSTAGHRLSNSCPTCRSEIRIIPIKF